METQLLIVIAAALAGLSIVGLIILKAWQAWLAVKRPPVSRPGAQGAAASPATRIMLADLKERVRRLEQIADGVE